MNTMTETTTEGTMTEMTTDLLLAWGCPGRYARDYDSGGPAIPAERAVRAAANWYHEHDRALAAMIRAGDHRAIRAWAESAAWDEVARETSDDGDPGTYAEDVREAMRALADEVEG